MKNDNNFDPESLKRLPFLRKATKLFSSADIQLVISKLIELKRERVSNENQALEDEKIKAAQVNKILSEMKALGVNIHDLKTGKKPSAIPIYKIVIDGQEYTWSGKGRKPKVFMNIEDLEPLRITQGDDDN